MGYKFIDWFRRWFKLNSILGIITLRREDQMVADHNPWENPPKDIMEAIALRLNLVEYISSSRVCKSWRSLLLHSDISRPQIPWLLFPHNPRSQHIRFYNVLENKYHHFTLPEGVHGGKIVGCSKGWVVFTTKGTTSNLSLFNPIFGVKYLLPSLPTTSNLQRVVLSSPTISNCTVAAIFDKFQKLAVCKLGDRERWEVLEIESGIGAMGFPLFDVMFCKQKLHVLIRTETGNGMVEDMVVKRPSCGEAIPIVLVHDLDYKNNYPAYEVSGMQPPPNHEHKIYIKQFHGSYLVESTKGEAMLIQKHHCLFYATRQARDMMHESFGIVCEEKIIDEEEFCSSEEEDIDPDEEEEMGDTMFEDVMNKLEGFMVYEIQDLRMKRRRVRKGLEEEEVLFLSKRSRVCLPSTASNGLLGNSIHFLRDDAKLRDGYALYFIGGNGIHFLDDSTVHDLIPELGVFLSSKFMWFAPNLMK